MGVISFLLLSVISADNMGVIFPFVIYDPPLVSTKKKKKKGGFQNTKLNLVHSKIEVNEFQLPANFRALNKFRFYAYSSVPNV